MNAEQLLSIGKASRLLQVTPQSFRRTAEAIGLKPKLVVDGVELFAADEVAGVRSAAASIKDQVNTRVAQD